MNIRNTVILMVLFFAGLAAVWYADYRKIPTAAERRRMLGVVVPELARTNPAEIKRVEILGHPKGRITFERGDNNRWQMIEPVDALADSAAVETLLRNLRGLRPVPGAETIKAKSSAFGLDHPERTVRVFGSDAKTPIATIDVGATIDSRRYVHDSNGEGAEVVDAKLLASVDLAAVDWREKGLFTLSTFEVDGIGISGSGRDLEAMRMEGRWRLVKPYHALLDPGKMEGVMATLGTMRAAGPSAFVADDVHDFAPYGLDHPRLSFELDPEPSAGKKQVVEIGKDVPDSPGKAYARRADQNEVIAVDTKMVLDLGADPKALRSQRVAEVDSDLVSFVQMTINGEEHALVPAPEGWRVLKPSPGRADATAVRELLAALNDLQTSEFFDPEKTPNAGLEKPWAIVKVWERGSKEAETPEPPSEAPETAPMLTLRLGKHNAVARAVYALTDDCPTILILADKLLKNLPSGPLGYRERTLLAIGPNEVQRVSIERDGKTFEVQGGASPGRFEQWAMEKPSPGPADAQTVAQLVVFLANLRAETLVTDDPASLSQYGLDSPILTATWSTLRPAPAPSKSATKKAAPPHHWTLNVGKFVPAGGGARYAKLSDNPTIFTLGPIVLQLLAAELRDHRMLAFDFNQVDRVVFKWPGRTVALARKPSVPPTAPEWAAAEGSDASGVPSSQVNALLAALSNLAAVRFTQYEGTIPADSGLDPPVASIEIHLADRDATHRLRLGALTGANLRLATTATGSSGPVAALAESEWLAWVSKPPKPEQLPKMPADVFNESGPSR
jgi:hypothetical protein